MKLRKEYNDDQILLDAVKHRERSAFVYIYEKHTGAIKNFVKSQGGQDVDAEEIEQNVIIHLYEKVVAGGFVLNEKTKLSTYMYAVGKNMWYKKLSKTKFYIPVDDIPEDSESLDFYESNPTSEAEDAITKALDKLDDDCKNILTQYYYDKKSMREIAESMKTITEENLRKRKYKCIQKIKTYLITKINLNG